MERLLLQFLHCADEESETSPQVPQLVKGLELETGSVDNNYFLKYLKKTSGSFCNLTCLGKQSKSYFKEDE